jgi:hypothetical protein
MTSVIITLPIVINRNHKKHGKYREKAKDPYKIILGRCIGAENIHHRPDQRMNERMEETKN